MTLRKRVEALEQQLTPDDEELIDFYGIEARPSEIRRAIHAVMEQPSPRLPDAAELAEVGH